ncbi:nucleotide sugar dehydrogenase [Alkalithermobacter paradoxus]|uniref:UDP-N-acetyl-D-glucosamine 6-dehydrogenase n=1 Tax=Alkalithermobacter paradoxus TaxID=29349 RepID=A0A1V4I939_9FIRM|nr:UDP-N-acetyl-D-glucosamine 6-dehydrogenase [[Clostridium] thermoalcaliphilum]
MDHILSEKIKNKEAKVGVVGLGYVGLPLAVELANSGFNVFGIDICEEKINMLKSKKSYVIDINSEVIEELIDKKLSVGSDFTIVSNLDIVIICVPTPLNEAKEPDLSYIVDSVKEIRRYLKKRTLIILESTTYPGTTEELIINSIEEEKSFKIGKDFFVCYSPERVDPGNKKFNITNTPKVIGGATKTCLELGILLYSSFVEKIVPVSCIKVAEMVKLFENTFRSINIALVNELTQTLERIGINIWEVIDAASTKPFGFFTFYPGPGIGGHCIPLDPIYLSWKAKKSNYYNRFIELASDINSNMPRYVVSQVTDILNNLGKCIRESNILLVGVAYKKDIDDLRESPAIEIFNLLEEKGASVSYYDTYISYFTNNGKVVYSIELTEEILNEFDLVIITTNHSNIDYEFILSNSEIVYDTRNVTSKYSSDKSILLGRHINSYTH